MNEPGKYEPYQSSLLAGILASLVLVALAATILLQLLFFPQNSEGSLASIYWDPRILRTLLFTVFQAAVSTFLSISIGIALAWALANQSKFPFRGVLIALVSSALVLPTLVVVLGVVTVYGRNGWLATFSNALVGEALPFSIYGLSGILLAHVFFNASFAARVLLHRFQAIPAEKHKLCMALGMGFFQKVRLVELPSIIGALPGLSVTIFLLCFTSFAIVLTLGGSPSYNTLEVSIYEAIKFDFDLPRAFQLAMVQITICIILVAHPWSRLSAGNDAMVPYSTSGNGQRYLHWMPLGEKILQSIIIILFTVFFIAPLLAVTIDGAGQHFFKIFSDPIFIRAFFTSIIIATASTLLAVTFSLAIASAIATLSSPERLVSMSFGSPVFRRAMIARMVVPLLSISAMLYLVFPALVLGLGFFILFQHFGGDATWWAACVVTISNALIAIPFAVASLRPAIIAAGRKQDRLCLSLGLGRWMRWKTIDWPMLKDDISYVGALAFCFSLGDLGVIALFGSDEFKTLPWLLYQKFGSYRTQDASAIALVMLILVIGIFWLAQSRSKGEGAI